MKDIHEEQAEKSASEFGKFGSAEELLSAYNALESEFTKRCQLLKQLQTELSELRAQAENGPAPDDSAIEQARIATEQVDREGNAAPPQPSQTVTAEDGDSECDAQSQLAALIARAAECAEALCAVPEVMDACIAEYKKRLSCGHALYSVPAGMAVIAAPARPKTLSDAKALADKLLSQQ